MRTSAQLVLNLLKEFEIVELLNRGMSPESICMAVTGASIKDIKLLREEIENGEV